MVPMSSGWTAQVQAREPVPVPVQAPAGRRKRASPVARMTQVAPLLSLVQAVRAAPAGRLTVPSPCGRPPQVSGSPLLRP